MWVQTMSFELNYSAYRKFTCKYLNTISKTSRCS